MEKTAVQTPKKKKTQLVAVEMIQIPEKKKLVAAAGMAAEASRATWQQLWGGKGSAGLCQPSGAAGREQQHCSELSHLLHVCSATGCTLLTPSKASEQAAPCLASRTVCLFSVTFVLINFPLDTTKQK